MPGRATTLRSGKFKDIRPNGRWYLPRAGPSRTVVSTRAPEPFQVCLVPGARLLLAGEQRVGLGQDERVGAALPPGHVGDGQFGAVDPGVDVLPAPLGERPLVGPPALVLQERAEGVAQLAGATARAQSDRPVAGRAPRAGQPGAEPCRAAGASARSVLASRSRAAVTMALILLGCRKPVRSQARL